jgi:hypothetical protein
VAHGDERRGRGELEHGLLLGVNVPILKNAKKLAQKWQL